MGPVNLALWAIGVLVIALGYLRFREPWRRYQGLRAQEENADRYEAWRGRSSARAANTGPSGAQVAMDLYRRQYQLGIGLVVVGFVIVVAGFAVR